MKLGALLGPIVDARVPGALAEQVRRYAGDGFQSLWSAQAIGRGFMFTDPSSPCQSRPRSRLRLRSGRPSSKCRCTTPLNSRIVCFRCSRSAVVV